MELLACEEFDRETFQCSGAVEYIQVNEGTDIVDFSPMSLQEAGGIYTAIGVLWAAAFALRLIRTNILGVK